MKPNLVRIPVSSHGLHRNPINSPYLGTFNFMDVCPVYYKDLRKGERTKFKAGMFSRLNPTTAPSFFTGRYRFTEYFVPHTMVFRPWYAFDEQTKFNYPDGTSGIPGHAPYTDQSVLSAAIIADSSLCKQSGSGDPVDFYYWPSTAVNVGDEVGYYWTNKGTRFIKVLNSLGYTPTFDARDTTAVNLLVLLSYVKIFVDHVFPANYVGSSFYDALASVIRYDDSLYSGASVSSLLSAVSNCTQCYYDDDMLSLAFDDPVRLGASVPEGAIEIQDITNNRTRRGVVTNDPTGIISNNTGDVPNNGTPVIGDTQTPSSGRFALITQYVIDSLQALNNFCQKHRLAGGRLLDRFLVSRGLALPEKEANVSYYLGSRDLEINVDAVVNTTDINLGEMAGKGLASTGDNPFEFKCKAEEDGIYMIVCEVVPDANKDIQMDPYNLCVSPLDFYHAAFDKLGPDVIPSCVGYTSTNGRINAQYIKGQAFGWLNRYYGKLMNRPRLVGDFRLASRGALALSAFHTFRIFDSSRIMNDNGFVHGYGYCLGDDASQYQRLFYSSNQDNLQLFIRFIGDEYLEKLPLGDSFDWDDDEYNEKVTIVKSGSRN